MPAAIMPTNRASSPGSTTGGSLASGMNNSSGLISVPSGSVSESVRERPSAAQRKLAADYLACPSCHGPLELAADEVVCGRCSATYPVVDDVLILVPSGQDAFAQQLRARYEATSGGTSLPAVFRITR